MRITGDKAFIPVDAGDAVYLIAYVISGGAWPCCP
jgi:hypothetical protein